MSRIQEDHSSLEALFNSLETRVESTETTLIKEVKLIIFEIILLF